MSARSMVATVLTAGIILAGLAQGVRATGPAKGPVKVFLMAGQSSVEGHAEIRTIDFLGEEPRDASGPAAGMCLVTRGGSWQSGPDYCRPSVRRKEAPATRTNTVGFWVVAEAP
jgi:hypothetical protein